MDMELPAGTTERRYKILFALMLGMVMAPLDGSMVNVILPILTEFFNADLATAQWVPMIYLLVLCSLILFFGRLGDIWGYKKVFLYGIVGFATSSALCGLAPSIYGLIVFRGLQALTGAMIMAVPLAIITACFPSNELGRALGIYSIGISVGLAVGPTFGGFVTAFFGWRFTFLINVPIGIVGWIVAQRTIPDLKGEPGRQDIWGAVTAFICLFGLLIFINRVQAEGLTVGMAALLVVTCVAGAGFLYVEKTVAEPMLNLNLFKNATFSFAGLSALLNFMAQYVAVFLTPFLLHRVMLLPANKVGLVMTVFPLAVMVVAPFSGWLSDRTGSRLLSCIGALICMSSLALMTSWPASATPAHIAATLAIFGIGTGIFQSPNTSAAMGGVPRPFLGVGSAILATLRQLGMVLGIALAGAVLHAAVPDEILRKHSFDAVEAKQFLHGLDRAFIAGAFVAGLSALTAFIRSRTSPDAFHTNSRSNR